MRGRLLYSICLVIALGLVGNASGQTGEILIEWWTGITGGNLSSLLTNANYPDKPAGRDYLSSFEVPQSGACRPLDTGH